MNLWARNDSQASEALKIVVAMRLDYVREIFSELGITGDELEMRTKLFVCYELLARGATFITLIHPSAIIGRDNKIGQGCVFCPRTTITTNVTLGDFVTLNASSGIGHDALIGNGVTLSAYCDVTGNTVLGEGVFRDAHSIEVDGKVLRFKKAAIATGARAVALPIEGLADAGFLTNENVSSIENQTQIGGVEYTKEEIEDLVDVINSGPLPALLELQSKTQHSLQADH